MRIWIYADYCGTDGTHSLYADNFTKTYILQEGCNDLVPPPDNSGASRYECRVCGKLVWGGKPKEILAGQIFPQGYDPTICHTVAVPEPAGTLLLLAGVLLLAWLAERRVLGAGRKSRDASATAVPTQTPNADDAPLLIPEAGPAESPPPP